MKSCPCLIRNCSTFLTRQDEFVTVIAQLTLSPSEICGIILGDSCAHVYNPLYNWTLPMTPIPKPPVEPKGAAKDRQEGEPVIRVLQLSDTHVDTEYQEGGDALCGEPLCCRKGTKGAIGPERQAGFWGDYRDCDIPLRTLDGLLKHVATFHQDLDYVLWTGDVPAHDVWNQTRDGQLKLIRTVSLLLERHLGHLPLFPALGNHESAPVNRWAQSSSSLFLILWPCLRFIT